MKKKYRSVPQTDFREESWSGKNKPLFFSDSSHFPLIQMKKNYTKSQISLFLEKERWLETFFHS